MRRQAESHISVKSVKSWSACDSGLPVCGVVISSEIFHIDPSAYSCHGMLMGLTGGAEPAPCVSISKRNSFVLSILSVYIIAFLVHVNLITYKRAVSSFQNANSR